MQSEKYIFENTFWSVYLNQSSLDHEDHEGDRLVLLEGLDLPFPPCSCRPRGGLYTCLHGSSAYTGFILGSSKKNFKKIPLSLDLWNQKDDHQFFFLCGLSSEFYL
jgi:hypothetical protein